MSSYHLRQPSSHGYGTSRLVFFELPESQSVFYKGEFIMSFKEYCLVGTAVTIFLIVLLAGFYPLYKSIRRFFNKDYQPELSDKVLYRIYIVTGLAFALLMIFGQDGDDVPLKSRLAGKDRNIEIINQVSGKNNLHVTFTTGGVSPGSYLLMASNTILNDLKVIAKYPEIDGDVLFFVNADTKDHYGNPSKTILMKIAFDVAEFKKVNPDTLKVGPGVLRYYNKLELFPLGKSMKAEFCKKKTNIYLAGKFCY